jgi:hypothetical protein
LKAVHDWTDLYRPFWQDRLKGLGEYLDKQDSEEQA